MSNARDKANIPALNFSSTGIDDNATSTAITIDSSERVGVGTTSPDHLIHISASSSNAQLKLQRTGSATASFNISASSDSLAFSDQASSTERMRVNSTGLGIGTSSPANNLHIHTDVSGEGILVKSTGNTYNEIIADANRTGSADTLGRFRGNWNTNPVAFISINTGDDTTNKDDGRIIFSTSSSGSSPTERMRIQPNGNVGIGTSSPAHNLEIVATNGGSINDTLQIRNNATSSGTGSRIRFINSTDENSDTNGAAIASVRNGDDNDLVFEAENSEAMRIDHAGNVGIGTSSPDSKLNIEDTKTTALSTANDFLTTGLSVDDSSTYGTGVGGGITFRGKRNTSGTQTVFGAIVGTKRDNSNDGYNGNLRFFTNNNGNGIPTEHMRIDHDGNVIFQGTQAYELNALTVQVDGSLSPQLIFKTDYGSTKGHQYFINNTTTVGSITSNTSSTSFNTSSDYRLKENVSYDFDATTRLKQLKPARFNFIADADKTVDGFLAHEVSDIVPEAITGTKDAVETYTDDDGNEQTRPVYQGIDQSKLVPLLVKTIQELEARITALETNQP